MSIGGRLEGKTPPPRSRCRSPPSLKRTAAPAVWVFDQQSGSLALKPVTVARYEANTAVIG